MRLLAAPLLAHADCSRSFPSSSSRRFARGEREREKEKEKEREKSEKKIGEKNF